MSKKSFSRVDAEKKEGLPITNNEVPANRMQGVQQVADTESALSTKPVENGFGLKHTKGKGSRLKQEVISEALTGASDSAGMGINAAGRGVSGTAGGILGANDSTPVAGQFRSSTRVGKKFDRLANKINFQPCEQVAIDFDESRPLADASGEDQGYNGTYRNEFARSQKIMGAVPGDLMFQRSVDMILKDKLYFIEGQQLFQSEADRTAFNPGHKYDTVSREWVNYQLHSGNYLHRGFDAQLDSTGKVIYALFDVEDLTPDVLTADDANVAAAHRLIKSNVAEIDRQVMDAKAGDEKADIWTPLARATKDPTATSYLLSSIEAETGAYVYLAYSKATTNFSYQLNRAAKDGQSIVTPAIEQCVGWRIDRSTSLETGDAYGNTLHYKKKDDESEATANAKKIFHEICYDAGDPQIMIAAYDSVTKYNNKADLLLQPRGWRMHLQTADNNMNALHVSTLFPTVYAGQETFSTIDHEYDPLLPICMTDKANLISVHNFNELGGFIRNGINCSYSCTKVDTGYDAIPYLLIPKGAVAKLGYDNLYVLEKHTGGDGVLTMNQDGEILINPDSHLSPTDVDIELIVVPDYTQASVQSGGKYYGYALKATVPANYGLDVIFAAPAEGTADDNILSDLAVSYGDKLYYNGAGIFTYMYSDLRNFYHVDVKHPLIQGLLDYLEEAMGSKFYTLLSDTHHHVLHVPFIFSTQYMTLAQLLICAATPWIQKARINSMRDVIYYEDNTHSYPFSKLSDFRGVPFKNYVNFGYTGYDEPLETKVMNPVTAMQWVMPEFFWKVGTEKYVAPWYFNENELNVDGTVDDDASCMSFPSIRSGARLAFLDQFYGISEKDVRLALDRMTKTFFRNTKIDSIGAYKYGRTTDGQPYIVLNSGQVISIFDILSCPRELGLCMDAPLGLLTVDPTNAYGALEALTADGTATSIRIKLWCNNDALLQPTILSTTGVNISRAANFTQKWMQLFANNATTNTSIGGLVFGLNDEGNAQMAPFASLGSGAQLGGAPTIRTVQRSLWTRVQMLPFVISPFDAVLTNGESYPMDIYDLAYTFGLAGFRASDYRESVYNRNKQVVNEGMLFVNDPWIEDSAIVKHGASSTGLSITKGYEVK